MKEFEKRIGGKEYTWLGVPVDMEITNAISKQVWKEALEWTLSLNSVRVHDDVYEDIKKELKDDG